MAVELGDLSAADERTNTFRSLRATVLDRAASLNLDLLIGLKADELATITSGPDWAQTLYAFIIVRTAAIGERRHRLWENAALIRWCMDRLLALSDLTEEALIGLLYACRKIDAHVTWESSRPSVLREVLHEERKRLQDGFVEQIQRRVANGKLNRPEEFIEFDTDGRLLPMIAAEILRGGVRFGAGVALLYFLRKRGDLSDFEFLRRSMDCKCFLVSSNETLIIAGELHPGELGGVLQTTDFEAKPLRLTWWLDVNFPREQLGDPRLIAARVPLFVRALLTHDQATLCLNATGEASWFSETWVEWMGGLAEVFTCRPDQIIYFSQNARFPEAYAAARARLRSPAFGSASFNAHLFLEGLRRPPHEGVIPSKRFLCLNQRPSLPRTALMLLLHRDGLLGESNLSFNQPMGTTQPMSGAALQPWMQTDPAIIDRLIAHVAPTLPLRLDLSGQGGISAADGNFIGTFAQDLFAASAVYLVTESEMEGRAMRRFTEKTVKGLAASVPFIVFGNGGTLTALKDLGFQTFSPWIDESYDEIEDPIARFHRAYAEVTRLSQMPMAALIDLRQALRPVLDYNRAHLLNIAPIVARYVGEVFATVARRRATAPTLLREDA